MRGKAIASMVLGILSLEGIAGVSSAFGASIVGLALAVVALVLSKQVTEAGPDEATAKFAKAGKITGLIGAILSGIGLIVGIICFACAMSAISSLGAAGAADMLNSLQ